LYSVSRDGDDIDFFLYMQSALAPPRVPSATRGELVATFAVRVKSVALLFEPLDTSGSKAGTQFAHTHGGEGRFSLGCARCY